LGNVVAVVAVVVAVVIVVVVVVDVDQQSHLIKHVTIDRYHGYGYSFALDMGIQTRTHT
jgi:hypothetical protein